MEVTALMFAPLLEIITDNAVILFGVAISFMAVTAAYAWALRKARGAVR